MQGKVDQEYTEKGSWVAQPVKRLSSAQVVILESWDEAPH